MLADSETLLALVSAMPGRRVLIIGDLMLDEYIWGDVTRISPEAPVPIVHKRRQSYRPGGAGNVAVNVAAFGGIPMVAGVIGADSMANRMAQSLAAVGLTDHSGLIVATDRPTTVKTRIMGHNQQMLRIDTETREPVTPATVDAVLAWVESRLPAADACLLSDYAKGLLTPALCQGIIERARAVGLPILVDPKGRDFRKYAGATVVTPNLTEATLAAGASPDDATDLASIGGELQRQLPGTSLLITQGAGGMTLFTGDECTHIAADARTVFDVTGAGDTVVATMAGALAAGAPLVQAAQLASVAAGIVVGKLGASTATLAEIGEWLRS